MVGAYALRLFYLIFKNLKLDLVGGRLVSTDKEDKLFKVSKPSTLLLLENNDLL